MRTPELIGVSEARDRFKDLVDEVQKRDVVVLRHNRPVALLVAPDRIERLLDRIEDLEDHVALLEHRLNPDDVVPLKEAIAEAKRELAEREVAEA
jgi:prevent-host-death family protein